MKILSLRFKNLNSLVGEWVIDFSDPEYLANGIFAITGPTGAGKSTILDAICLALYGRTPRLKAIGKNTNEIMSRQTGECFSEVTFATRAGKFCCHWSQHRAHKKVNGNLTDPKHELADALNGKLLETKKREVATAVEEKTGMDFDRFTRSMLLAQGGFAAFLQALPDDRAPILEQITGTQIYSEVSKRIHIKQRDENAKLELLRAQSSGLTILSEEAETTLREKIAELQSHEKELNIKNEEDKKAILWLKQITALKDELSEINHEEEIFKKSLIAFTPEKERLNAALKAAELDSDYATLKAKREQKKNDLTLSTKLETQLPVQENLLESQERALKECTEILVEIKNEQKQENDLIKKVREIDLIIKEKSALLKNLENDRQKLKKQLSEKKELQQKSLHDKLYASEKLNQTDAYLAANSHEALLVTELTGINEQLKNLKSESHNLANLKSQLNKLKQQTKSDNRELQKQQRSCLNLEKNYALAKEHARLTKTALEKLLGERLLREYRAEYAGYLREMAYLKKIENLEDERAKLQTNKPCPLCGSREHPFTENKIPETDMTEQKIIQLNNLIESAEGLENKLKEDEQTTRKNHSEWTDAEKLCIHAQHKKNDSEINLQRLENELQGSSEKYRQLQEELIQQLTPFAITRIADKNLDVIAETLNARLKKWQEYQSQRIAIEKKISELASTIKSLATISQSLIDSINDNDKLLTSHRQELNELKISRLELYGLKDPDETEIKLEKRVTAAEKLITETRGKRDQVKGNLNNLKTRIHTFKENISHLNRDLAQLEPSFTTNYQKLGFKDEADFLSSRILNTEKNSLIQLDKKLKNQQTEIENRKNDRAKRLADANRKQITTLPLIDLQERQSQIGATLNKLVEEIGALKEKLTVNTDAKNRYEEQLLLIEKQKQECCRWERLHSLIGSADGKKFRNFAQGLTFEVMVSHANRQLQKMSDRYLLIRDQKQPLELNVIDNYQASETRSTKNLSGGESFIVSLSLALGLSKMASQNVQVDSLFLDEGFGTLDEDALETALETLATLHEEGKLIGIISHVGALKERISTQINIHPLTGGKSTIEGPGCKKIRVYS